MRKYMACAMMLALSVSLFGCADSAEKKAASAPAVSANVEAAASSAPSASSAAFLPAAAASPSSQKERKAAYRKALDGIYEYLSTGSEKNLPQEGTNGIHEMGNLHDSEMALSSLGYALKDVNGDGAPELLIGMGTKEGLSLYGADVDAIYTYRDGKVSCLLEGWSRNVMRLLKDGSIWGFARSSAAEHALSRFTFDKDGGRHYTYYYFSRPKDADPSLVEFYKNTVGESNPAVSEKLSITPEKFYNLDANLADELDTIAFIPFVRYPEAGL